MFLIHITEEQENWMALVKGGVEDFIQGWDITTSLGNIAEESGSGERDWAWLHFQQGQGRKFSQGAEGGSLDGKLNQDYCDPQIGWSLRGHESAFAWQC